MLHYSRGAKVLAPAPNRIGHQPSVGKLEYLTYDSESQLVIEDT